jgi:pSer/pThr/pTyr-binding forkhead associated (FHA) protein
VESPSPSSEPVGKLILSLPDGVKEEFLLSKTSVTIGRATACDIVVQDGKTSRTHAELECGPTECKVTDLGSRNGTRINGAAVQQGALKPGDVLSIGDSLFRFERAQAEPDAEMTWIESKRNSEPPPANLSVQLHDTSASRLAIHTPTKTWEVELTGDELTIGRDVESNVFIDHAAVSRHHAVIRREGDRFTIRDLQSGNGTYMGGQRIATAPLLSGGSVRIGPAELVFKQGFSFDALTVFDSPRSAKSKRPPVVVIPGFGGSRLWRGNEQIWPVPRVLLFHPDLMRIDEKLEPRGLVNEIVIVPNLIRQHQYSLLTDYLTENLDYESGNDLLEFGYDFRQDNRESAKLLAAAIDEWDVDEPITIIAHSMGCLVARYYVELLGGHKKVGRVILLGGPHAGTPYAFAMLLKGPGLVPVLNARLRDVVAGYPSWYQILPTYPFVSDQRADFPVLNEDAWLGDPHRQLLKQAREFRKELGTRLSVPSVCIFGYGLKTITGAKVERDPLGKCSSADLLVTKQGDGTIPEVSAVMPGTEIHPVQQQHGALYVDNDVRMRLKLELTRGVEGS